MQKKSNATHFSMHSADKILKAAHFVYSFESSSICNLYVILRVHFLVVCLMCAGCRLSIENVSNGKHEINAMYGLQQEYCDEL